MLKEKVIADVPQVAAEKEKSGEISIHRVFGVLGFVALGVLLPRANIYGVLSPFGISLVAATDGIGSLLVNVATLMGYLLAGEVVSPLRYMAAVAITGAMRWVFGVLPSVTRKKMFAPLLASAAALSSGLVMSVGGSLLSYLLLLAESLIAGGFTYFFREAFLYFTREKRRISLTTTEQTGCVLLGAAALMAAFPLEVYYISPARMIASLMILLFARAGREQSGSIAGVVLGTALALCSPERLYIAAAFAFGGLLAGVFSHYGRFAAAGVYLIADVLLCLTAATDIGAAACIYESVAACMVFILLPRSVDKWFRRFLIAEEQLPAVEGLRRSMTLRLDVTANALREVADTVDTVSQKMSRYGAPDLGSMYRYIGDTVCANCNFRMLCWEKNFVSTTDALNRLTPVLREKGYVEAQDLDGYFSRNCRHLHDVVAQLNRDYRLHLQRETAWNRLSEIRAVITDQFSDMGEVLGQLGRQLTKDQRVDTGVAGRVISLCEDFGMPVEEAVCILDANDRMTVEILAEDVGVCTDGGKWFREMQVCCGREFDKPTTLRLQGVVKVTLNERPQYRLDIGVTQSTSAGEKLSGDVCERYEDAGCGTFILSDGMGSGGRAAVDSAMAAGICAGLLRAGLSPNTALKMVNTALLAKSGDESLTTLDVLQVDLFDGSMHMYKAGAVTSLLKSNGRISRIEAPALPVGILRDATFAEHKDRLEDGDLLLMMSDGLLADGIAWVEEYVKTSNGDAKSIANGILELAKAEHNEMIAADDVTIAAVRMVKR